VVEQDQSITGVDKTVSHRLVVVVVVRRGLPSSEEMAVLVLLLSK
jgi:hypothetical protein